MLTEIMAGGIKWFGWLIAACIALLVAPAAGRPVHPLRNFVYLGQDELDAALPILDRPDIAGAEIIYVWRNLEPSRGGYDFSMIEHDLALTQARGKALFVEVLDRFFTPTARYLPQYMLDEPRYGGGLARQFDDSRHGQTPVPAGWIARQWDPEVRGRFQALLAALAARFDGRIAGIILTETAATLDRNAPPAGFDCDAYFNAEEENILFARRAFSRSQVVQYVNFWPCEWNDSRGYMSRFFGLAAANHIGVGGPDIVPYRPGQMANSYPFIRAYRNRVPLVAMAVQEPTLEYLNPQTGRPFTRAEFEAFAIHYLGVDIIFWTKDAPWLRRAPPARALDFNPLQMAAGHGILRR
jgi:hypothetical protein